MVLALAIPPEEVEKCRRPVDIPQVEGLPPELLENLALRFGAENPDAPVGEQVAFLKEKTKDFAEMEAWLAALTDTDARLENVLAAARAAMADGDFEGADERLGDAEEMQQAEHTLVQVGKQAAMRAERGQARLFAGDVAGARGHFERAAGFFEPFDRDLQAGLARELADQLYHHGVRYGGDGLPTSEAMYRDSLAIWTREASAENWAMVQNDLAVALQEQGIRLDGAAGADKLGEAVAAYRAALEVYTREALPVDWAMTQVNLALVFVARAEAEPARAEAHLRAALVAVEGVLEVLIQCICLTTVGRRRRCGSDFGGACGVGVMGFSCGFGGVG